MGKRRNIRLVGAAVAALTLAGAAFVGPAQATGGGHGWGPGSGHGHGQHSQPGGFYQPPTPWKDAGSYDPECAGYDMTAHYSVKGVDWIRTIKGTKQAFLGTNTFRFREAWKDNSSGEVLFTWRGTYKFSEYDAKQVWKSQVPEDLIPPEGLVGPIFLFRSYEKFKDVFRDADGRKLFRSNAVNLNEDLFDTLGDRQPGGVSLRFETVKRFGHDPLLDASPCDFLPAVGSR